MGGDRQRQLRPPQNKKQNAKRKKDEAQGTPSSRTETDRGNLYMMMAIDDGDRWRRSMTAIDCRHEWRQSPDT
ncbi:hypothetical protein [Prochlorothrix hollandica]|uniref:Uncharacterized protein n=1 Tax=Prochlorothrix hollandica PCC 9006 = CALU 1027 TaxID=317619 RepID=A0A0M2Q2C4_PROHO|nr:hypothetical protein [Prochlorothrix hollandica]KKJ01129.1 hypothetical protein PROH_01665 [Prochlorothrix hollandica PCC 9006 = CALU 1027]